MKQVFLDGLWKIRWCDGQRGGMPHYLHTPGEDKNTYLKGLTRTIDENDFDSRCWIEGSVPGEIHLDLHKSGIISSPYEAAGIMQSRWVEECFWFYRKEFNSGNLYVLKNIILKFTSLDLCSVIFLNGEEIARHNNAFRPCIIDVTGKIKEGNNILTVQIESGLYYTSEKISSDYYSATMTADILLHKRNWLRKTQSQMSWDWSPRLMNVGITGSVLLIADNSLIVEDTYVSSEMSSDLKQGNIRVRVKVKSVMESEEKVLLKVKVAGNEYKKEFVDTAESEFLEIKGIVKNPILWWPVNMGEQFLHNVEISVFVGNELFYNTVKKTGFRHVEVDQSPHPEAGNYFVFKINRIPVFMKGANMVPADIITSSVSSQRYEKLINRALEANFNFLRIWGGGLYETDLFYELCDRYGILVWQEFIAACAVIPANEPEIFNEISAEAQYQIRRISNHPSLVAWCGNNEIGWGCNGREDLHCGEDNILYEKLFPELLMKEDPEKYYQPTSPFSADIADYNDETTGDQHPWSVGFHDKDSRKYENMICRFANEGGILGPTSLENLRRCLLPGESYGSFSWQVHDNMEHFASVGTSPDCDLSFWTGLEITGLTHVEYVYAGGVVQGEGLKRYIENFRRRKFCSSGAVFWMYNDCWPATRSWTIVDYTLNRTPSYHPVRRAFSPIAPVIVFEENKLIVYGVNDFLTGWEGRLNCGAFTADGEYLYEEDIDIKIPGNSSVRISNFNNEKISFPVTNEGKPVIIFAQIFDTEGNLLARTRYTSLKLFELGLQPQEIIVVKTQHGYEFKCNGFAMCVCIDINGNKDISDNFFDLYPGKAYEIFCPDGIFLDEVMIMNDFRLIK